MSILVTLEKLRHETFRSKTDQAYKLLSLKCEKVQSRKAVRSTMFASCLGEVQSSRELHFFNLWFKTKKKINSEKLNSKVKYNVVELSESESSYFPLVAGHWYLCDDGSINHIQFLYLTSNRTDQMLLSTPAADR